MEADAKGDWIIEAEDRLLAHVDDMGRDSMGFTRELRAIVAEQLQASEAARAEVTLDLNDRIEMLENALNARIEERDQARSDLIAATADIAWRDELAAAHPRMCCGACVGKIESADRALAAMTVERDAEAARAHGNWVGIEERERTIVILRSDLAAARNPDREIDLFDAHDVDCVNHGAQQMAEAIRRAIDRPGGTLGDSVAQGIAEEVLRLRAEIANLSKAKVHKENP